MSSGNPHSKRTPPPRGRKVGSNLSDDNHYPYHRDEKQDDVLSGTGDAAVAQQTVQRMQQQQRAMLLEAARTSAQAVETGHDTSAQLAKQGETIERVDRAVDDIEYELKVSDRIVKSMSGIGGMVTAWFWRKPKPPPGPTQSTRDKATLDEVGGTGRNQAGATTTTAARETLLQTAKGASGGSASKNNGAQQQQQQQPHHDEDLNDKLLDEIGNNVAMMREQAVTQRTTIDDHSRRLDELHGKVDKTNTHMRKTELKMKRIT